jgi:SAM-dependent methyltransferase
VKESARLKKNEGTFLSLRYADEATRCPACASAHITVLDVFPIVRDFKGRRLSFLTGCDDCGLLFANPLRTQEEAERYYAEDGPWAASRAEHVSQLRARQLKQLHRRATRSTPPRLSVDTRLLFDGLAPYVPIFQPPPGAKVLDYGCGRGVHLNWLQDLGWDTYGLEPSTDVAFLRHQRVMSAPQDNSFHFGILHHVLEHVTDPVGILGQLGGALREGGVLYISVPALDTLPRHGCLKYCLDGRKHLMCFSEACLTGLLARAGFAAVGRVEIKELDERTLAQGRPLRLRIVAKRTLTPPALPSQPLRPALDALAAYSRAHESPAARARRMLPLRFRAALMDRARVRKAQRRRNSQ